MAERACKCLNVRIRAQPAQGSPPEVRASEFEPIYAGESGINVLHNHLTLRTRAHAEPEPQSNGSLLRQYMSLTCLICNMIVYRVVQLFPPEMEGTDGPILPTEDWVEQEALKSSSGWLELSKTCLTPEAIATAESSGSYSPIFRVVVPPTATLPATPIYSAPLPTSDQQLEKRTCLPPLPPIISPAPFTPSHIVFAHLASIASERSQQIRQSAEEYLAQVTAVKLAEIKVQEDALRRQVQVLWFHFRERISELEEERREHFRKQSARRSNFTWSHGSTGSGSTHSTPISVQDFVVSSPPPRTMSPSHAPRMPSALSASLATSAFHHPRTHQNEGESSSFPNFPARVNGESRGTGPFRRTVDEDKDTATSFKYTINLEAEMERAAAVRRDQDRIAVAPSPPATIGDDAKAAPPHGEEESKKPLNQGQSPKTEPPVQGVRRSSKSKGKRKVTFDIKPDVVAIDNGVKTEKEREEAVIFDLEDEVGDHPARSQPAVLPFIEPPYVPRRPTQRRSTSGSGLPESFSLLRPNSLPAPSALHASPPHEPSSSTNANGAEPKPVSVPSTLDLEEQPLSPREAEITRLVAAGTPSHRNAWKRDGKAWQTFVNRQGGKDKYPANVDIDILLEPEEDEEGEESPSNGVSVPQSNSRQQGHDWSEFIAKSLPVFISPNGQDAHNVRRASYYPKISASAYYGSLFPTAVRPAEVAPSSAAALRKASYAERDRSRSMDPGVLDFESGDDDDESDTDEGLQAGNRGRNRALKILQARSELPSEGMWRSLAT